MAKKGNVRWIVGGIVIAGAIVGISFLNLGDNLIYFYTPSEAYAKAAELTGQNIKVGGMVTLRTSSAAAPHVAGPDAPRPLQQGTPKFMAPS